MKSRHWLRVMVALSFAAGMVSAVPALAKGSRMALACIGTKTGDTVYFAYRWGEDANWTEVSIAPGKWQVMSWRYARPNENRSPQLQVRYDDDMSEGENFVVTDIGAHAAVGDNCEAEGQTYHFIVVDDELFLDADDD